MSEQAVTYSSSPTRRTVPPASSMASASFFPPSPSRRPRPTSPWPPRCEPPRSHTRPRRAHVAPAQRTAGRPPDSPPRRYPPTRGHGLRQQPDRRASAPSSSAGRSHRQASCPAPSPRPREVCGATGSDTSGRTPRACSPGQPSLARRPGSPTAGWCAACSHSDSPDDARQACSQPRALVAGSRVLRRRPLEVGRPHPRRNTGQLLGDQRPARLHLPEQVGRHIRPARRGHRAELMVPACRHRRLERRLGAGVGLAERLVDVGLVQHRP